MDRPINKILSEKTWEREKKFKYVNGDMENSVNKINNHNSTTGRDQDVRTYPEIKSTVDEQCEPMIWEMGFDIFVIVWQ